MRQLDHDHAPHHPDGEGQQQRGHRQPQIAVGDAPTGLFPEGVVVGPPIDQPTPMWPHMLDQLRLFHLGADIGMPFQNRLAFIPLGQPGP